MKSIHLIRLAAFRGFTIMESLIVLVVLAIAATGIISLQTNIFSAQTSNNNMQVGVQLMQECAEKLLSKGRDSYADPDLANSTAGTNSCSNISVTGYAAPTVTLTLGNASTTGLGACPYSTGTNCKLIQITQGSLTTPITLMLAKH